MSEKGYGGRPQPPSTIAKCLNGGLVWPEVKCRRCETRASIIGRITSVSMIRHTAL
jgi:hypothetical protein